MHQKRSDYAEDSIRRDSLRISKARDMGVSSDQTPILLMGRFAATDRSAYRCGASGAGKACTGVQELG